MFLNELSQIQNGLMLHYHLHIRYCKCSDYVNKWPIHKINKRNLFKERKNHTIVQILVNSPKWHVIKNILIETMNIQ